MIPKEFKIFRVVGPLTSKTGREFWIGYAEVPNPVPGGFSTLRVVAMSDKSFPVGMVCKPESITSIDFEKGEARCRV